MQGSYLLNKWVTESKVGIRKLICFLNNQGSFLPLNPLHKCENHNIRSLLVYFSALGKLQLMILYLHLSLIKIYVAIGLR